MGLRGWACWRAGYGPGGPDGLGVAFEAVVRVAELVGAGVLVQVGHAALYVVRSLTPQEWAFAKTYHAPSVLAKARLHTDSRLARCLGIAFVLGRVVKAGGEIDAPLLVHELTHVAQFERWGWAYVAKALWSQHRGAGYAYVLGTLPPNLNAEQEAAYAEDEARRGLGLAPRWAVAS